MHKAAQTFSLAVPCFKILEIIRSIFEIAVIMAKNQLFVNRKMLLTKTSFCPYFSILIANSPLISATIAAKSRYVTCFCRQFRKTRQL